MKKGTLVAVVIAVALGAFVYFYDSKRTPKTSAEETTQPAFSIKTGALSSITIERQSGLVALAKQGANWELTKPVETRADQQAIESIVSDLSDLTVQRSFAAAGDLSKYGLANPASKIEFQDAKGAKHTIELGDKDFSGGEVYALVDNSSPQKVDMLPASLLTDADKPVIDLRDRSLLDLTGSTLTTLTIHDPSDALELNKVQAGWQIAKPREALADSEAVDGLISSLSTGKFTTVASESPSNLGKYGLEHPSIKIDATANGGKQFQLLLNKKGTEYYGRDLQRPMIFSVDPSTYDALNKKFFDLRDKQIIHFDPTSLATVEVQNASGIVTCAQDKTDEWKIVAPAADKGKAAQSWKLTDPLQNARAKQIFDAPSPAILAHLRKPAIEVVLIDKSGKATTIQISAASGDSVYVHTSSGPEVYELGTQILKDLGFKASDLLL